MRRRFFGENVDISGDLGDKESVHPHLTPHHPPPTIIDILSIN